MPDKSQPGRVRGGVAVLSYFALCLCSTLEQPSGSLFGVRGAQGKGSRGLLAAFLATVWAPSAAGPAAPPVCTSTCWPASWRPAPPEPPAPPAPAGPPSRPAPRAPPAGGRWRQGGDNRGPPCPPGLPSAASAKRPPLPSLASCPAAAQTPERAGFRAALGLPAS